MLINFVEPQSKHDRCKVTGEWFAGAHRQQDIFHSRTTHNAKAFSQRGSGDAVATQTQGADVGQVAFAAALDDRQDVVGIPERFARSSAKAPMPEQRRAAGSARKAELSGGAHRVQSAIGADTPIALEYLFSKVCGLCSEFPLVDTKSRTEGVSPAWNLKGAPATKAAAIRPSWNQFAVDPAALHGSRSAHRSVSKSRGRFPA